MNAIRIALRVLLTILAATKLQPERHNTTTSVTIAQKVLATLKRDLSTHFSPPSSKSCQALRIGRHWNMVVKSMVTVPSRMMTFTAWHGIRKMGMEEDCCPRRKKRMDDLARDAEGG